ncbi:MAG: CheY-like chemotaxis protein [Cognaticolwellia sp.]|jgi:CheY-like chemotaxis protein
MLHLVAQPEILVVDDERQIRNAISRPLRKLGYMVRTAADGIEAIENIAEHGPPTLMVLDLAMPRMDGRQVLARIRQNHPHLPVLVCTASDARDLEDQHRVAVLEKPWDLKTFMARVQALLQVEEEAEDRSPSDGLRH